MPFLGPDLVLKNSRVRSISLVLFEIGIPNLVCGYILGCWSVVYYIYGFIHCDLKLELKPSFLNIHVLSTSLYY